MRTMKKSLIFPILFSLVLVFVPLVTLAQTPVSVGTGYNVVKTSCPPFSGSNPVYCPLASGFFGAQIPISSAGLANFLNFLVGVLIYTATGLAVLVIIYGGVQYTLSESVLGKDAGKKTIGQALLGLAIALLSYLILNTLNPTLLTGKINSLSYEKLNISGVAGGNGVGGGQNGGIVVVQPGTGQTNPGMPGSDQNFNIPPGTDPYTLPNNRITYYSHNEPLVDSYTKEFKSAFGGIPLQYSDTPDIVGSAATDWNIFPAGTVFKVNGHVYVNVDNNAEAGSPNTKDGAIDLFTRAPDGVEPSGPDRSTVEVIYRPPSNDYYQNLTTAQKASFFDINKWR